MMLEKHSLINKKYDTLVTLFKARYFTRERIIAKILHKYSTYYTNVCLKRCFNLEEIIGMIFLQSSLFGVFNESAVVFGWDSQAFIIISAKAQACRQRTTIIYRHIPKYVGAFRDVVTFQTLLCSVDNSLNPFDTMFP